MKNRVTIGEFDKLQEAEKYNIVWQHGFMIGKRNEGEYEITLFSLFSFYVELFYDLKINSFNKIIALSKIENMDVYRQIPSFKSKFKPS